MRGTLFLNRASGARLAPPEADALVAAAGEAGIEIIELAEGVDCNDLVRERLRAHQRLFIAAGGDGTVSAVMQSLVRTEGILGVIPGGTYNHFAKDLGIPLQWRAALEVALGGTIRQIDVGRVNDRFFLNNVSLGLYPEFVARREEKGRDYPRWKARLYSVFLTFRHYPHVTVAVETDHYQQIIRTHVFMVSNNSYDLSRLGIAAPRNTLDEGRLDVYWLPHVPRARLMKFVAHYLAGRVKRAPGFRSFRTTRLKVNSSRDHLHLGIDGEVFALPPPLMVTVVPQSLLVRVPR